MRYWYYASGSCMRVWDGPSFSGNIEKLEVKKLEDTARMIDKTLFENNIYLTPDTAYFYKLEYLLRTGRQVNDEGNFANMICKI